MLRCIYALLMSYGSLFCVLIWCMLPPSSLRGRRARPYSGGDGCLRRKKKKLFKIAGMYNMADLLTKHLGRATLDRHATNLCLRYA